MKQFFLTWLGAFVMVTVLLYALNPLIVTWPIWSKALVISGIMVWAMPRILTPLIYRFNSIKR